MSVTTVNLEVKLKPQEVLIMATSTLLIISSIALGFILSSKVAPSFLLSSIQGDALPLLVFSGLTFVVLAVSVMRYRFFVNEIANQVIEEEPIVEEVPIVQDDVPLIRLDTFLADPAHLADLSYDQEEQAALQGRLNSVHLGNTQIPQNELFDVTGITRDQTHQNELTRLHDSLMYFLNKLALFMEAMIEADFYIHAGKKKTAIKPPELLKLIEDWDKAFVFFRDQIVEEIFLVLQGKKPASSFSLFGYFLNFYQKFFFPLAKMETLVTRRVVTAHNFDEPAKAKRCDELRKEIGQFFEAIEIFAKKENIAPVDIASLTDKLVKLSLAPFESSSPSLQQKAADFFRRLLSENSFRERAVLEELEKCKHDAKKSGHPFTFLLLLFHIKEDLIKKGRQDLTESQKALKQAFDQFFQS